MSEFIFQQSYFDVTQSKMAYGTKRIKVDKDFTYVIFNNQKSDLIFIKNINFGNPTIKTDTASRDIEMHTIFRADGFDDFVVVRRFNNNKYIFDRIDYMNVEYR